MTLSPEPTSSPTRSHGRKVDGDSARSPLRDLRTAFAVVLATAVIVGPGKAIGESYFRFMNSFPPSTPTTPDPDPEPETPDENPDFAFRSAKSPVGSGSVGEPYAVMVERTGPEGPATFEEQPTLGAPLKLAGTGLKLNTASGEITGTPLAPVVGKLNVRMKFAGASQANVDKVLDLAVADDADGPDFYPVTVTARQTYGSLGGSAEGNIRAQMYRADGGYAVPAMARFTGNVMTIEYTYKVPVNVQGIAVGTSRAYGPGALPIVITNMDTGQSFTMGSSWLKDNNSQVKNQYEQAKSAGMGQRFRVEIKPTDQADFVNYTVRLTQYGQIFPGNWRQVSPVTSNGKVQ